jgi:carboxyl-terminal processing protease
MSKAMRLRLLGSLCAALALVLPARADEAQPPKTYVVLVGISNYADKQIKPRPHAEDDVKALYDLLSDKKYLGTEPASVQLLLGSEDAGRKSKLATRENVLKALNQVSKDAKANDLVLFAFIGEGCPLGESGDRHGYFASDSTFKNRDKDAIAASEIQDALKNLKAQHFCAFVDVDFKGFTGAPKGLAEPSLGTTPYKEFLGDDGSDDHAPTPGRVLFLATNGLTRSLDAKDHGVFAEALLKGLKGAADKDGYEPDGIITVDELAEYLDKELPELARQFGKTQKEKEQLHFVLGGRNSHFVLVHNPAVAAKVAERLEKLDKLFKADKLPAKFYDEGKTLLGKMPRLEAQRNVRKEYQALVDGTINLDTFETKRQEILDATKMRRTDALEFAEKVMEVTQLMRDNHVKEITQGDMVNWAIRGLYKRIDEKIPEEIEARLKKVSDLKESDLTVLLADVRQALGKREDLAKHKDLDVTLQRMLSHFDPYTTYIDPETKRKFDDETNGNFTGIGIQIRKDSATDMLLVVTPIKGSPAYKAGLQAGDVITTVVREVDSQGKALPQTEVLSTKGLALNDAVKKILGQPGTKVKVIVQREGVDKPLEFEITRGRVEVETAVGYKRNDNDTWNYWVDKDSKIAYVRLTLFARNTYRDLKKITDDLTKEGVKGFILDLRYNPGGLLDSAVKVTDLFIDDGVIVTIRPRAGREAKFRGTHAGSLLDFPMVCMVNGMSASGSEIVSAALQDHKRALIVGERSYGKGSVQNIQPFADGELKLTTASFWRPSDKNLNKASTSGRDEDEWGVTPDKIIKLTRKQRDELFEAQRDSEIIDHRVKKPNVEAKPEFKDVQLEEALEYLRGQIKMASRAQTKKAG